MSFTHHPHSNRVNYSKFRLSKLSSEKFDIRNYNGLILPGIHSPDPIKKIAVLQSENRRKPLIRSSKIAV